MLSVKINVFEEIMFQKSYSPIVQGGYGSQLVKNKPLKLKYLEVIFQFSYRDTVIWNVNFRYRYLLPSYHTFLFIVAHDNQKSVKLATQNTYTYIFSYLQHTCIFFVLFYYPQHSYYLLVMIHLLKSYQKIISISGIPSTYTLLLTIPNGKNSVSNCFNCVSNPR